jgi:hypothetical protein
MRQMIVCMAFILIVGCATPTPPERTLNVSNSGYKLDELFTDGKGYTVYRFYDQGEYRYYVVGPNGAQMLPTTKTVHETDTEVITVDGGGSGGGGKSHRK